MAKRDNFTTSERKAWLALSAAAVCRRWPEEFRGKPDHYICENCHWVHDNSTLFEIDHIQPCAGGGTAGRWTESEAHRILDGDFEQLWRSGFNARVLCRGCNRAKWANPFVPEGSGYARKSPYREMDRNPDHIYHGGPL